MYVCLYNVCTICDILFVSMKHSDVKKYKFKPSQERIYVHV